MEPSLEDALACFFPDASPNDVHHALHQMQQEVILGRLGMLPRPELADRALLAEHFRHLSDTLYRVLVATWGDDPSGWQLPQEVKQAVADILALHFSRQPASHAGVDRVEPAGASDKTRPRRRGRRGV